MCSGGALASGGDIHRANLTVAAITTWCENRPGCAGFTSNTNGTKGVCTGGAGDAVLDVRFKDQLTSNTDGPGDGRPGKKGGVYGGVLSLQRPGHVSLCDPPNATCAKVTYRYLAGDCFGECNATSV